MGKGWAGGLGCVGARTTCKFFGKGMYSEARMRMGGLGV